MRTQTMKMIELGKKCIQKKRVILQKAKRNLNKMKEKERLRIKQKEDLLKAKKKELDKRDRETRKREEEIEKLQKHLSQEKKKLDQKSREQKTDCEESRKSSKRKLIDRNDSICKTVESKRKCNEEKNEFVEKEKQIEKIFESEMTCSVCHEYFINAVNLNCSHTFCFACIEEWKSSNGGKHVCPICREGIENQNRELVLDNLIDRYVAKMKPNLIEHRKNIIEERKKKLERKANQAINDSNSSILSIFINGSRSNSNENNGLIPQLKRAFMIITAGFYNRR